jgi:hypothetical protein
MLLDYMLDSLRCIEPDDNQCHGSYVTELGKYDPSLGSNHTLSAIQAGFLSQLDIYSSFSVGMYQHRP